VHNVIGALCLAKWDENGVWYKATIRKDCKKRGVEVSFINYNKRAFLKRENIVWNEAELPKDAVVDLGPDQLTTGDLAVPKWSDDVFDNNDSHASNQTRPLKPGSHVHAKILANAASAAAGSCSNVQGEDKVPVSQLYCSRGYLNRKGVRVPCSSSAMCWGCALKTGKSEDRDIRIIKQEIKSSDLGVKSEKVKRLPNTPCIVKSPTDGIWYNGMCDEEYDDGSALVYFIDYGNSERVEGVNIVGGLDDVPPGDVLDPHLLGGSTVEGGDAGMVEVDKPLASYQGKSLVRCKVVNVDWIL